VKVREIIVAHREIIPLLRDIATLKKQHGVIVLNALKGHLWNIIR